MKFQNLTFLSGFANNLMTRVIIEGILAEGQVRIFTGERKTFTELPILSVEREGNEVAINTPQGCLYIDSNRMGLWRPSSQLSEAGNTAPSLEAMRHELVGDTSLSYPPPATLLGKLVDLYTFIELPAEAA